jgi:hypothetical protein
MVKYRGIEINVISQFDIRKLPEYSHSPTPSKSPYDDPFQAAPNSRPYPVASCSIPIHPGSQIWFEYAVDGPHPPNAAYFFKLLINDVVVTSWDCTAKHGFHGKMMYNLVCEGRQGFSRQALRFSDGVEGSEKDDVVQINVYRIEKRVKIRNVDPGVGRVKIRSGRVDGLRWVTVLLASVRPHV